MSVGISPLAELAALGMTQQVKIKAYLGTSGNGTRLYAAERTYPCRIEENSEPIFTATGQQVVSKATIAVYPRATDGTALLAVSVDTVITLPDGTSPRILRAGAALDVAGGTIHWRILT